ncbi:MAG: aldehyde dehydrogenase [Candidatus Omnitrophica bacterium]|jgi:acyl-CoA reductase-like NAD-dependent aldehyde dehydrogenase|nr:aldehyde dehydrogenase [Candidatus Omnitrophota bacterium]
MENYTLLVGGKEIDTGNYEYYPYACKAIFDFKAVRTVIKELKRGSIPEKTDEYVYARYSVGDENICQDAIKAAYEASKVYRHFSIDKRHKIAVDIHDLLLRHKKQIIELFIVEGHPLKLAEWEFEGMAKGFSVESLNFFKEEMKRNIGVSGNEKLYLVRRPDGVVCLSPPKNAPASNSFVAAGALFSGNTIIVKPPFRTPLATTYVWKNVVDKAARMNGVPPGTVNIIIGNSDSFMDEWLKSRDVNDIIHFGISDKGIEIGQKIFAAGKKPILELSGNDLLFVWKDADINQAAKSLMDAFLGSTQICMVPKNALIHEDIFDCFCDEMAKRAKALKIGLPDDPETCLSPVIKIPQFFEFLEDAKSKGAVVICGGHRVNYNGKVDTNGIYLEPTLLKIDDERKAVDMLCVVEENFFPLIPLVKITGNSVKKFQGLDKDDVIFSKMACFADCNAYGLRISAWVKSKKFIDKFASEMMNSGLLRINSRHVGFSFYIATHGGTKKSGGPFGEMNYIWAKTSHLQGISITD